MTDAQLAVMFLALKVLAFMLLAIVEIQEVRCGFCHF